MWELYSMSPVTSMRLLETHTVTPLVCAYQAYDSKLRKLNFQVVKADRYLTYLGGRCEFVSRMMIQGKFPTNRGLLVRKERQFKDEERLTRERLTNLTEEVGRVKLLFEQTRPCEQCRACLSLVKFRRNVAWTT